MHLLIKIQKAVAELHRTFFPSLLTYLHTLTHNDESLPIPHLFWMQMNDASVEVLT